MTRTIHDYDLIHSDGKRIYKIKISDIFPVLLQAKGTLKKVHKNTKVGKLRYEVGESILSINQLLGE